MAEKEYESDRPIKTFVYLFVILLIIWLLLTSSFNWQELGIGILVSTVLALFLHKRYRELGLPPLSLRRIVWSIMYVAVLMKEIVLANLDVAYRVIHPKMPIKPGIVMIKTGLKQDIAKLILANSITLTPGTFVLDIWGDRILIHWINVRSEETVEATRIVGEKFERYLKVIFA